MDKTPAVKPTGQKKSFWRGVKSEFSKVVWPTKKTLFRQTVAVVTVSVLLGALIAVVDNLIQYGLDFILQRF